MNGQTTRKVEDLVEERVMNKKRNKNACNRARASTVRDSKQNEGRGEKKKSKKERKKKKEIKDYCRGKLKRKQLTPSDASHPLVFQIQCASG